MLCGFGDDWCVFTFTQTWGTTASSLRYGCDFQGSCVLFTGIYVLYLWGKVAKPKGVSPS